MTTATAPVTVTTTAVIDTQINYSLLEDQRNQHRDKAQTLLKLAEAVEDSNQRRRKFTTNASRASLKDLTALKVDLEEQLPTTSNTSSSNLQAVSTIPTTTEEEKVTALQVQQTLQHVVTAITELREHSHLQYQMLEMKYFDVKRHAFDVEHQNRKLQLINVGSPRGGANAKSTAGASQSPTTHGIFHSNNIHQEAELMAQVQQENDSLRRQLRESCLDCRKLVQENYGLRKILLDARVNFAALLKNNGSEEEKQDDLDDNSESNQDDGFEDAREFSMDTVAEETDTDLILEDNGFHIIGVNTCSTNEAASFVTPDKQQIIQPPPERTSSTDDPAQPKRGSSSNKSVTFAVLVTKLKKERQTSFSCADADGMDSQDEDNDYGESFATAQTSRQQAQHDNNLALLGVGGIYAASSTSTTSNTTNNTRAAKKDKYGIGMVSRRKSYLMSGCNANSSLGSNNNTSPSSKQEPKRYQQLQNKIQQRRHSHSDAILGRRLSKTKTQLLKPTSQAISAKDLMKKSKKNSGKRRSFANTVNNTFRIHMSEITPPMSPHQRIKVSRPVDPLEEEQRLSALLGGFRPGMPSSTLDAAGVASASLSRGFSTGTAASPSSRHPDYYNDDNLSVSSSTSKGFFRRRKSKKYDDDEDNMSISSAKSLGSLFSFKKSRKKASPKRPKHKSKAGGGDDSRSVGSNTF